MPEFFELMFGIGMEFIYIHKLVLGKAEEQEIKFQHLLDHRQSKRVPEKHLFLLY